MIMKHEGDYALINFVSFRRHNRLEFCVCVCVYIPLTPAQFRLLTEELQAFVAFVERLTIYGVELPNRVEDSRERPAHLRLTMAISDSLLEDGR